MVRKLALLAIGRTSDMSSLSSLTGQPPRLSSEAKPVPKSSRATRTPSSASWAKKLMLTAAVAVCSLTSSASIRPGTCSARRNSAMTAGNPGSVTESGSTLTEIGTTQPAAAQTRCCTSDSRSISRVSSPISPSCAATGVNRAGGKVPNSGCSQRTSDSAATTRPEDSSTSGW